MKKHVKIYLNHFDYGEQDFIPCEMTGKRAVDIHHIDKKGMGGSKTKDHIENLAALSREAHERAHREPAYNQKVKQKHLELLQKPIKYKSIC